jgi:hypothetical protein
MTLQLLHSEFPNVWEKFYIFLSVYELVRLSFFCLAWCTCTTYVFFCLVWPVVKVQLTFFSLSYLWHEYSLPFMSCLTCYPTMSEKQLCLVTHKVHIYLEYHSVWPLVRIGTPTPSPASKWASPGTKWGHTRAYGWGGGGPNSDDWRKRLVFCLLCCLTCLASVKPMIVFSYLWHLSVCYSHSGPVGRGILEQTAPLKLQIKLEKLICNKEPTTEV